MPYITADEKQERFNNRQDLQERVTGYSYFDLYSEHDETRQEPTAQLYPHQVRIKAAGDPTPWEEITPLDVDAYNQEHAANLYADQIPAGAWEIEITAGSLREYSKQYYFTLTK